MIRDRKVSGSVVVAFLFACFVAQLPESGCASSSVSAQLTSEQAWNVVKEKALNDKLEGKVAYVSPGRLQGGATIKAMIHQYRVPEDMQSAWVVFIDDAPAANWEHPCRYVFVDPASGKHSVLDGTAPPDDLDTYAKVYPKQ